MNVLLFCAAPCIPQTLGANMDCVQRVASLTWQSSWAAQSYVVTAENNNGQQLGLTTNSTSVQISDLQCGQQYYFKVSSVGQGCRSKLSNTSVLQTGVSYFIQHFRMQTGILKWIYTYFYLHFIPGLHTFGHTYIHNRPRCAKQYPGYIRSLIIFALSQLPTLVCQDFRAPNCLIVKRKNTY